MLMVCKYLNVSSLEFTKVCTCKVCTLYISKFTEILNCFYFEILRYTLLIKSNFIL